MLLLLLLGISLAGQHLAFARLLALLPWANAVWRVVQVLLLHAVQLFIH